MRKSAFTLVELLVVIAIIALLMAILVPALSRAKDHAKRIICMNNLRTLGQAWYMYQDDNDARLCHGNPGETAATEWPWIRKPTDDPRDPADPTKNEREGIKLGALFPYVKNIDVYRCPADARKNEPGKETFGSYSIAGGANGEGWGTFVQAKSYLNIKNSAMKYIFVEECDPRGTNVGSWVMNLKKLPEKSEWVDPFAAWHRDRSCLGYADTRVEMHRWIDQSTLEMCELARNMDTRAFFYEIPASEHEDVDFMAAGFPYKSLN